MKRLLRWSLTLVLVPLCLLAFLPETPDPVVVPGVFRWRNSHWMDGGEEQAIRSNGIQRVYMKVLDIDWNSANGAHPVSTVHIPQQWRSYYGSQGEWTGRVELVPCIYITNNTFLKLDDQGTVDLARNLLRKLRMERPALIRGVMLDCDWTAKTKARFFRLTRIMNDSLDVPLTVTIRLHHYAQPGKTGVPPADRGMLMPYNVGRITEPGNVNSIFDRATAEPYFKNKKSYPLPLDIGLPAFSWGVQFRKGAFVGILSEIQMQQMMSSGMLNGPTRGTLQVVNENDVLGPGLHLGDEIRVEELTPAVIAQVTELARTAVNSDTLAVVYFEASAATFQRMQPEEVRAGFARFGPLRTGDYFIPINRIAEVAIDTAAWMAVDTAAWSAPDTTMR